MKTGPLSAGTSKNIFGEKDVLFKPSKQVYNSRYKRATFHLLPGQIKDIKAIAFYSDKDISEVVREALQEYIFKHKNF